MKALPHLFTGVRIVLSAAALVAADDGRLYAAATLITLGAVTDGLDGLVSRWLAAATPFGAAFDYFADYLCFIVAPWTLARALLGEGGGIVQDAIVTLPLVTGAIRYARNTLLVIESDAATPVGFAKAGRSGMQEAAPLPGLGTVFFAFVCVAAVFLDARTLVGAWWQSAILLAFIGVFSLAMITPVRYPKLTRFKGMSPAVLVLLTVMPFFGTRILAGAMLVIGLLYAALAPLLIRRARVS